MQTEIVKQPRKGKETEEILGREEGVRLKHREEQANSEGRLLFSLSQEKRKKYGNTNAEIDIARILFWQVATGERMREFSLSDLNLLRKMEDKVVC